MISNIRQREIFKSSYLDESHLIKFKRDILVRHLPKTRANVTIVWFENTDYSTSVDDNIRLYKLAQDTRCSVLSYSSITKCIKYLKRARSREYVVTIIISYPIEELQKMIYRLQQYRIVQTIYIVSSETNASDYFLCTSLDINFFQDKSFMHDQLDLLINDIEHNNFEGGLFTTFNRKEKALKDIGQELAAYVWQHVCKVLITDMTCDSLNAKQEMLKECRAYYRNNPVQLAHIDNFERTYEPNDAIHWYTKDSFLFYIVNKALRSGDMLALYTFRYFIKDFSNRVKEASVAQSATSFRLYRGAKLHRYEVESLQIGSIVSTNSFFSCSHDRNVAEMFIGQDSSTEKTASLGQEEALQRVLFEIDIDLENVPDMVVANMSAQSQFQTENEMVFMLGSTFIINHIVYNFDENQWYIKMSSHSNIIHYCLEYEAYVRKRLKETDSIILFGNILVSIESDYMRALDYFYWLLRTLPVNDISRPEVYHNLGRIYRFLEKYENALACFQCAQLLLRRVQPERVFDYCRILGGIGSIYARLGDPKRAIKILQKAITLQRKSLPDNHGEIPFHLHRLGYAYFKAQQYENALLTLASADRFFKIHMPVDHHKYGQTLLTLGLVNRALDDEEKAYNYFKEGLHKCNSFLFKDHPIVASISYQLSLIHENRGDYETAIQYATRALRIRSVKLPYYHSKLKQSIELVERLQQRKKCFIFINH